MRISRKPNETLNRNYSMSNKLVTLFMLIGCLKKAKAKTRRTAYYTTCCPVLECTTHTWSPYKKKLITQLGGINRKGFRWVYSLENMIIIFDLMLACDWPTLSDRRINNIYF